MRSETRQDSSHSVLPDPVQHRCGCRHMGWGWAVGQALHELLNPMAGQDLHLALPALCSPGAMAHGAVPSPCHWQQVPSEGSHALSDTFLGQAPLSTRASHGEIWAVVPSCWCFPSRALWLRSQSRCLHAHGLSCPPQASALPRGAERPPQGDISHRRCEKSSAALPIHLYPSCW